MVGTSVRLLAVLSMLLGAISVSVGSALALPDHRGWELVSPVEKFGAQIEPLGETGAVQAQAGGGAMTYLANAPVDAMPEGDGGEPQILSVRSSGRWETRNIAPPHERAPGVGSGDGSEYRAFASDLSAAIVQPFGTFNRVLSPNASEQTAYLRTLGGCSGGCYRPLVTAAPGVVNVPPGTAFGREEACQSALEHGPSSLACGPLFRGATPDLSHVVLTSEAPLVTGAGEDELYEWSAGDLQLVSLLPPDVEGHELPAPAESARLGFLRGGGSNSRRAISSDGTRVFWESAETLYMRDTARGETIQIDTAEAACAAEEEEGRARCVSGGGGFQIASADGDKVFFTDQQKLTKNAGATFNEPDLYECRIITAMGRPKCVTSDLTPATSGTPHADVLGGVLGASLDGETLYAVANGVLAPGAAAGECEASEPGPEGATCNLYVLQHGASPRLVTRLSTQDYHDWSPVAPTMSARVSPDGNWVAFMSQGAHLGYDNTDAADGRPDAEVYVYRADGEVLGCASCEPTGARPVGVEYQNLLLAAGGRNVWPPTAQVAANIPAAETFGVTTLNGPGTPTEKQSAYQPRYLSDQGRLFFNSVGGLVSQDANKTQDVYQYEPPGLGDCASSDPTFSARAQGCVALISAGTSAQESAFLDASESGADVFFLTSGRLSGQDTDNARDVYDAHICSTESPCFTSPPSGAGPCSDETTCRSPAPPSDLPIFGAPTSAATLGTGNLPPLVSGSAPPGRESSAERLAKALKHCAKERRRRRREACKRAARKHYTPHKLAKGKAKKASNQPDPASHRRVKG